MFLRSVFSMYFNEGSYFTQGSASEVILEHVTESDKPSRMLTNSDGEFNSFFFFFVPSNVIAGESFCLTMGFLLS